MRIIKCAYSKTFPISQYFEKIYMEAELNEGDDVRKELYNLKKQVNEFFYESNASAEKQMGTQIIEVVTHETNVEWEETKSKLLSFDNADDAQKYLDSTTFNMTIEAKQIINSIKSKHGKK